MTERVVDVQNVAHAMAVWWPLPDGLLPLINS